MSISSSLQSIYDSKQAIKASLINKGQSPTDVLSTYSSLIDAIETGGSQIKFTRGDCLYVGGIRTTEFPIEDLDTSEMINMRSMFNNFSGVSTIDLSEWDMTKVTNMESMFQGCKADYLVLGTLMPTALTDVWGMFYQSKFKALDLHNLPICNVIDLAILFGYCKELESINLTGWNTSKATNMCALFYGCSKLTSVDLSSFDTSNVTNMSSLLSNCSNLTSIDLSSFDTSNVTDMNCLFWVDVLLTSVTGFSIDCNTSNLNISSAFDGCRSLTSLLFKSGGTMGGKSTSSEPVILDLSTCTEFTESSVVAMINSCSANTSGYVRGFKLAPSVYSLLTEDDIALFTAKNYTVSAGK